MKILIFGAGPLGSLLAARLHQGGQDVSLLARGKRLDDLREHGVCLRNWSTGMEESAQIPIVAEFTPQDHYDMVIVVMRKNSALKALPQLARNKKVPLFLFLMNNAAGPAEMIAALGAERVMMGFPGMAGYHDGRFVTYATAEEERPANVILGEVNGLFSDRVQAIAHELEKGRFIQVTIEDNMDAWSKYHVALLFPAPAPALYLCANDHVRLSKTRDAIVLSWRGIKEAFSVLKKLHYPLRPAYLHRYLWLPEPLAVAFLTKLFQNPRMEVAMGRHAAVIRDEIMQLNAEFRLLIDQSGIFTPVIDFLTQQFDKKAPLLPEGSRTLRMDWSELFIPLLLLILLYLTAIYILRVI